MVCGGVVRGVSQTGYGGGRRNTHKKIRGRNKHTYKINGEQPKPEKRRVKRAKINDFEQPLSVGVDECLRVGVRMWSFGIPAIGLHKGGRRRHNETR